MTYLGNDPIGIVQALKISEIDDTAGAGDTNKTWSADKLVTEIPDVQINSTSIVSQGVANIPVAGNDYGVAKISQNLGVNISNGYLCTSIPDSTMIKAGTNTYKPVVPSNQHESVFYGLAKAAGDSSQAASSNAVGTYTTDAKASIQTMLGVPGDVQVNGTSVVSNGVANVPLADSSNPGVVVVKNAYGVNMYDDGSLFIVMASANDQKTGSGYYKPIVPNNQHLSAFYGLAKAAGDSTQSASSNAVGTYTADAKAAIQSMLGVPGDVQVNGTSVVSGGVANVPVAGTSTLGVCKINGYGLYVSSSGLISINKASTSNIKAGTNEYGPIVPANQDASVFYGLAKAAGDSTQASSSNAVGTYTADAKSAIQAMLGVPRDVQVDGTSVVNNGVANVPAASADNLGAVKVSSVYGISLVQNSPGMLCTSLATDEMIKSATNWYKPIGVRNQHHAVFYGLATAAGDSTQASSSNAVGTYTDDAKSAIQSMLGIESGISLVETVSGTTPTITGQPNVKYVCGEVSTLSITPPANGTIDVIFTSGSTATVLTLPNTVKLPAWFDATSLETDTIYEIMISDGVYGSVMTWAN